MREGVDWVWTEGMGLGMEMKEVLEEGMSGEGDESIWKRGGGRRRGR